MFKTMLGKKIIILFTIWLILLCNSYVYAGDYTDPDSDKNSWYDRYNAYYYANTYWEDPNDPIYYDFTDIGGDCTNFASQVIRAGGMGITGYPYPGNYNSWYYYDVNTRSYSWTDAHWFRYYWGNVNNQGNNAAYSYKIFTKTTALNNFNDEFYMPLYQGDVIQYADSNGLTGHTQIIYNYDEYGTMYIAQHTANAIYDLEDYIYYTGNYYVFRYQIKLY